MTIAHLHRVSALAAVVLFAAAAGLSVRAEQAVPAPAWSVRYSRSGGFAGISRELTISSEGALTARDRRMGRVSTTAPADLVIIVGRYVESARERRGPDPNDRLPDVPRTSFSATRAGREQQLELPADLARRLEQAIDDAFQRDVAGTWWQSAWKLCSPAAAMTAADIDPSIEELVLYADGRFSVRWPGGPRSTDIPHAPVPDYTGRYRVLAGSARIEFEVQDPGHALRDFAGAGTFAFDGDRLVLSGIWFGTRVAPRKPDVCELTFTRTSTRPSS